MVGKTNAGGGGTLTTVIAVIYPSGSICTCGGKKAKDTGGYALFNVKAGTYTVECHTSDNSQSKSTSVTVAESDAGKVIDVTLSYELVLFDDGSYADETGGWNGISGNYLVASVSGVATGQTGLAAFYTNNKVDLTGYSTLHFTIAAKSGDEDYSYPVGASANTGTGRTDFAASASVTNSAIGTTVTISISSVNTSYYIRGVVFSNGGGSHGSLKVSKVWLT